MRRTSFHLRARILLLLLLGVSVFGSVNAWVIRSLMLRTLRDSLASQGRTLSRLIAEESAPFLLRRDHLGLANLMEAYRSHYPETLYIVAYDAGGTALASTFRSGEPPLLAGPRRPDEPSHYRTRDTFFQDFGAPILGGTLGSVRIGLAETAIRRRAAYGELAIFGMVFAFFLAGAAGSYLIAQNVHRAATELTTAVGAFRLEDPVPALPTDRGDELGLVARALEDMMGRLKALNLEHLELLARLRDADRISSVGLLASGLAHDINNPLSGLLLSLERIGRKPGDWSQVEAYLPSMIEASRHIQDVVGNLLQFVRHQRSTEGFADLEGMVQKACLLAEHRLPKGVVIQKELPAGLPRLRFDPASLLQVLVNLLMNAADAMEGRPGAIRIAARRAGGGLELCVADCGQGMPPEVLERAFDTLFTTKAAGIGTGLGLPIARQLMRDHGGDIELRSEPGEGTQATLLFRNLEV